ncbi:MAG TPA: type II secretion system F family protein, partial [Acidimicrobiales bacterium]|nr:type II secretion system F family protein [Acidimicrobiales bacterium]
VALLTGWPVAGVLGGFAAVTLPAVIRTPGLGATSARAEGVAGWTELIRDALSASAGLAQAIVVTAPSAPVAVRPAVRALGTRLSNGVPMETALRRFASEVGDPAADFVVCALLMAVSAHAQKLADVLGALAVSIREDVAMRLRVEASRAGSRSGVRTIVLFSVGFAALLVVFASAYLAPYGSAGGQMMLALVGALYIGALGLMVRLVRPRPPLRLLAVGGG